jgi:hypothetical protein
MDTHLFCWDIDTRHIRTRDKCQLVPNQWHYNEEGEMAIPNVDDWDGGFHCGAFVVEKTRTSLPGNLDHEDMSLALTSISKISDSWKLYTVTYASASLMI